MSVGEYENEPLRGLPEYLPEGEHLLWQGEPNQRRFARTVFHVRSISIYFAILIALHLSLQLRDGESLGAMLMGSSWMLGLGALTLLILFTLAWAYARSTVYTLTNKRLVMRFGVAMPMMINLPLSIISAADMRRYADGSGDIILTLDQKKRLSYMMLWPNVRPWHFNPTQPALRSVPDVDRVAAMLASAADTGNETVAPRVLANDAKPILGGQMLGAS